MSVMSMISATLDAGQTATIPASRSEAAFLDLSGVSIDFPTRGGVFRALDKVNLKVAKGEFVSIIGHSGSGKSTVLNIVAGLSQATEGGAILQGREVNQPGPDRAVVFQNHALLPCCPVALVDLLPEHRVGGKGYLQGPQEPQGNA